MGSRNGPERERGRNRRKEETKFGREREATEFLLLALTGFEAVIK
jgi:hypothetical protein